MFKKGEIAVALFTLGYIIAFSIYYLSLNNYEFLWYLGVLIAIAVIIAATLRRTNFDYLALWGLSIWGLLHLAGGGIPVGNTVLYGVKIYPFINITPQFYVLKMDQVIHFYGFLVATLVAFQLLKNKLKSSPSWVIYFISALAGMGFGAINEIIEFLAVAMFPQTGVGDYFNTSLDLISNFFGAAAGAVICWLKSK